jgi:hypothetical protein
MKNHAESVVYYAFLAPGRPGQLGLNPRLRRRSIACCPTAFKGDDGKLYIKLNWEKRWITLAAISTVLGLAFKLKDPKNLLGRGEDLGSSDQSPALHEAFYHFLIFSQVTLDQSLRRCHG